MEVHSIARVILSDTCRPKAHSDFSICNYGLAHARNQL